MPAGEDVPGETLAVTITRVWAFAKFQILREGWLLGVCVEDRMRGEMGDSDAQPRVGDLGAARRKSLAQPTPRSQDRRH